MMSLHIGLMKLCDFAFSTYNPCHKEGNKCLRGDPIPCCSGRVWNLEWRKPEGGCRHLMDRGCTYPNLKCKSWVCKDALETIDPDCLFILQKVEEIGKKFRLIGRPFLGEAHTRD